MAKPVILIEEIILENFMSYEYARIPLRSGLNIICGPNGSGKSSILLAISVALGQAYTERSRRLSDLIRRGKDLARVSLLFNNKPQDGKRPIPFCRSDTFMLSRYLKKDGYYWYEADYREVSKHEVARLFQEFGINPDNMLIIMHQNMVEEFSVTSPQEKLRMVEEAVGFHAYRQRILDAMGKLSMLLGEEASVSQIFTSAEQTLSYWKGIYDKYLEKRELAARKAFLEREQVWANVAKQERVLQELRGKLDDKESQLGRTLASIEETQVRVKELQDNLTNQMLEQRKAFYLLLELEKSRTRLVAIEEFLNKAREVFGEVKSLESRIAEPAREKELEEQVSLTQIRLGNLEREIGETQERYIDHRVKEAVLGYQRRVLEEEIGEIRKSIRDAERKLALLAPLIEKAGERIVTERTAGEVAEEITLTNAKIQSLGEIPEDAEKMYSSYSELYRGLKEKMDLVVENRKRAMGEVEERKKIWRKVLLDLLDQVNPTYQAILEKIMASGMVRLINPEDVEAAGLELLVGFRGASPTVLDAYTQSGGERSVSVMTFLLALQRHVVSFFRAVDEFDIHMDSRNRDIVFQMIISSVMEAAIQYLLITPRQLTIAEPGAHIIVVQNVYGKSEAKEAL